MFSTDKIEYVSKEFVEEANNIFSDKLKKIILYGSYARGDYDDESDIDVMVLVDMTDDEIRKKKWSIIDLTCDIDNKYNVYLSPLVKNINHFNEWLPVLPFYKNVNSGVIWYAK